MNGLKRLMIDTQTDSILLTSFDQPVRAKLQDSCHTHPWYLKISNNVKGYDACQK